MELWRTTDLEVTDLAGGAKASRAPPASGAAPPNSGGMGVTPAHADSTGVLTCRLAALSMEAARAQLPAQHGKLQYIPFPLSFSTALESR